MAVRSAEFAACFAGSAKRGSVSRSGRPIAFRQSRPLVRREDKHEPVIVRSPIHIDECVRWLQPIMQREERGVAKRGLNEDAAGPDSRREERGGDVRTLAGALAPVQGRDDRGKQSNRRRVVSTARRRESRRGARIPGQRQQAGSGPVSCDVESWKAGVGSLFAVTSQVRINQPGIPLRDILVLQLQLLTRRMRRVDDQHVRPLDEPFQNLR